MKCFKCGREIKCIACNGFGNLICKSCKGSGSIEKIQIYPNPIMPMDECNVCNGTGYYKDLFTNNPLDNSKVMKCSACKGTGWIKSLELIPNLPQLEKCFTCNGSGKTLCFSCNGKGNITCFCI